MHVPAGQRLRVYRCERERELAVRAIGGERDSAARLGFCERYRIFKIAPRVPANLRYAGYVDGSTVGVQHQKDRLYIVALIGDEVLIDLSHFDLLRVRTLSDSRFSWL